MFQKGPGEGYMAAKDECLKLAPQAVCKQKYALGGISGYVVTHGGKAIGSGATARDAWNNALGYLRKKARWMPRFAKAKPDECPSSV